MAGAESLAELTERAGLTEVCGELDCPKPWLIDRVLYRGSAFVTLEPLRWQVPGGFVDEQGDPLSDHLPVVVTFEVSLRSDLDVLEELGK